MAAFKFDALELPHTRARIALCPCPGQSGQLTKDLNRLRDWGAKDLVTLIEDHEFVLLGVTSLVTQVEAAGMRWWHLPIRDMGVPDAGFEARWQTAGSELGKLLADGCSIAVHCRGGKGRTGTVAARLLIELGMAPMRAIEHVRAARPGSIETKEQELFLLGCR